MNKWNGKIGLIGSIAAIATVVMLISISNMFVLADYTPGPYTGFTAGTYGIGYDNTADNATRGLEIEAYHTQDASLGSYFAQVYVVYTGDNAAIRIGISTNGGTSFSTFEWVSVDDQVKQDYPDVQIYEDSTDNDVVKIVVVWQEKPDDDSEEWEIKARERNCNTNTWSSVYDVSCTDFSEDDNENILPKVSVCSDNSVSYWNVVWQREWDSLTNRYGIYLRRYIKDNNPGSFNTIVTIAQPSDNDDDYKHPATDCIPDSTNYEIVYILYDEYHSGDTPDNIIKLTYGSPFGSARGTFTTSGNVQVDTSNGGDGSQDYPDIAAVDDNGTIIVDCVWIENDDNDEVKHKRSINGGSSFGSETQIDDDADIKRCHVIWTTGTDVYYRDWLSNATTGVWNPSGFGSQTDGATTQYDEAFVDVSTSASSSTKITAYAVWDVEGTAVFFGYA